MIAGKHRLKWAAREAERQRLEEEERRRAFEEERKKRAEEEERRLAEEERRRLALAEDEKRRAAEEERRRFAEEERMKVEAAKERLAHAEMMEKERRRAAEALACEFPMTRAGEAAECDRLARGTSDSSNKIVSKEKKNAGKPPWYNGECLRARERYRSAHEAFKHSSNKATSDRYHEARKALDEAEQKAMKEHIEKRSHGEMGLPASHRDQKEGARWWNKECREAKQKILLAENKMKCEGKTEERKTELRALKSAYKKVCWHAKNLMESKERGVNVNLLERERKHITKLKLRLDLEVKKGAANTEGIKYARLSLNATIGQYETKYGTHIYFDSNGAMKEVQERDPSPSDPFESMPQDRDTSITTSSLSKTLDDVLSREADEAPWWNEECRKADEAFRKAHEVHDSGDQESLHIRSLWRNLIEAKRNALEDYITKNDVKGKEKERLLLFFHVNKEEARKRLDCYKALSEAGKSSAALPHRSNKGKSVIVQCVPEKSYNQWHEQWERQKMKVRELEMSVSSQTTAGTRQDDVAEHILKELDFEKGVLEEVVRCAREAGYELRPKWLPRDLFEALAEFEDVLKGPEDERERYSPRFVRFASKVKKAKSRYVLEQGLSGLDEQKVNMEAREIVSRYNQLIKKCCVGIKRKMKRVNFLEQNDVVGWEEGICPPGTLSPVLADGLEGAEYSDDVVELDANDRRASKSTSELIEDQRKVGGIEECHLEIIPCVVIDDDSRSYSSFSSVEILDAEGGEDISPPGEEPEPSSDNCESKAENSQKFNSADLAGKSNEPSNLNSRVGIMERKSAPSPQFTESKTENREEIICPPGEEDLEDFSDGIDDCEVVEMDASDGAAGKVRIQEGSDWSPSDEEEQRYKISRIVSERGEAMKEHIEKRSHGEMKRSPQEQAAYQADKLKKAVEILHSAGIDTVGLTQSQIFHRVRKYHKDQRFQPWKVLDQKRDPRRRAKKQKKFANRSEGYKQRKKLKEKLKLKLRKEGREFHDDEEEICPPGEEPSLKPRSISTVVGVRDRDEVDLDQGHQGVSHSQSQDWL